jgi:hypothetical protein
LAKKAISFSGASRTRKDTGYLMVALNAIWENMTISCKATIVYDDPPNPRTEDKFDTGPIKFETPFKYEAGSQAIDWDIAPEKEKYELNVFFKGLKSDVQVKLNAQNDIVNFELTRSDA